MKKFTSYTHVIVIVCLAAIVGCASSGGVPESKYQGTSGIDVDDPHISLAEYLQRVPGIQVFGSGENVSVKVRGASSFTSSTEPLFVVDGTPIGSGYRNVSRVVSMHQVSSIRVLKGGDASLYGVRGGNGVILIETRKD
jgi:TonB-dependent SusC/RagA subfamily outer membrane receptor